MCLIYFLTIICNIVAFFIFISYWNHYENDLMLSNYILISFGDPPCILKSLCAWFSFSLLYTAFLAFLFASRYFPYFFFSIVFLFKIYAFSNTVVSISFCQYFSLCLAGTFVQPQVSPVASSKASFKAFSFVLICMVLQYMWKR